MVTSIWAAVLLTVSADVGQTVSNVGLVVAPVAAALGCLYAAWRSGPYRRTWMFLGLGVLSWGLGQTLWTWYESVLGREVPFPSFADVGYLSAVPLVAAALISLPSGTQSIAGRARTVLDGLMIAGSLLLVSWTLVLGPVYEAGGDGRVAQVISLAYPIGDVVVITIVLFVLLRGRRQSRASAFPLKLIGAGLIGFALADSGFAYLTATGSYASGSFIDIGWFAGFALIFVAAFRPRSRDEAIDAATGDDRAFTILLPYAAVTAALLTSSIELWRVGYADPVVSWIRTFIIMALVARQILTLLENTSLTRHLQERLRQLRESEQRFEALVQHSSDVVTVVDANGVVKYQSESVERVFGYLADALVDRSIGDLLDADSGRLLGDLLKQLVQEPYAVRVVELKVRHRSGRLCTAEMTITNLLQNPSVRGVVLNTRDISERKTLEEQLVHSAFHDSLTSLANRALFRDRVDETLWQYEDDRAGVAVLFLDLDGFKQVNDLLGHASGDLLLVQVAERLRECVRPRDVVARLGGDEFGILLVEADEHVAGEVAGRVTAALREPFRVDDQDMHIQGSVGIAFADPDVSGADKLLRNADLAMYRAKTSGGGEFRTYDPDMHVNLVERLQLEADLRRALDEGQFVLHYQPTVELTTKEIVGAEALVRWNHPSRGLVPPTQFIPLAEEGGLIVTLGAWILEEACREAAAWRGIGANLTISVNISAGQLRADFPDFVAGVLERSGLAPERLMLEMTETVLLDHTSENLTVLERLKALGLRLAIDDFGTGYSSLSYLHRFPVDVLKIDRSFIERIEGGDRDAELVRTIVQLGQGLKLMTIAEGIEGAEQVAALEQIGCVVGQGYHFSRPIAAASFAELLRSGEPVDEAALSEAAA
jgi:diguanylate cyclase (GGDEF)-like protein/PAS domain S-box-containing protein